MIWVLLDIILKICSNLFPPFYSFSLGSWPLKGPHYFMFPEKVSKLLENNSNSYCRNSEIAHKNIFPYLVYYDLISLLTTFLCSLAFLFLTYWWKLAKLLVSELKQNIKKPSGAAIYMWIHCGDNCDLIQLF